MSQHDKPAELWPDLIICNKSKQDEFWQNFDYDSQILWEMGENVQHLFHIFYATIPLNKIKKNYHNPISDAFRDLIDCGMLSLFS